MMYGIGITENLIAAAAVTIVAVILREMKKRGR